MRLVKLIYIFLVDRWVYEERVTVLDCVRIHWEVFLCVYISMSPVPCPIYADVIQCCVSSLSLHPFVDICISNISNFGYLDLDIYLYILQNFLKIFLIIGTSFKKSHSAHHSTFALILELSSFNKSCCFYFHIVSQIWSFPISPFPF